MQNEMKTSESGEFLNHVKKDLFFLFELKICAYCRLHSECEKGQRGYDEI